MDPSRSERYLIITDAQKEVLVNYFNDGMTSTMEGDKINSAAETTGLTTQRIKVGLFK